MQKFIFNFFLFIVIFSQIEAIHYSSLPPEKEGVFPIHIPEYNGVEQFILLSNRWIIVATTNTKEVLDRINELSNGNFYRLVNNWESRKKDWLDWTSKRESEKIYNQYVTQARMDTGEFDLDSQDYYQILGHDDENYKSPKHPSKVTRMIVSLGKDKLPGEYEVHYAQYSYLEMPYPLKNGNSYTIQLKNSKQVTFHYDELHTVSRAIKLNQVGYLPSSKEKYAYLGCYLQEFGPLDCSHAKDFSVINVSNGNTVLKGEIKLRSKNPNVGSKNPNENISKNPLLTGEDTYEIDLSPLKEEGDFFISIPGIGRSWTFRHAPDVYGEAFYIAIRGMYHQRCGIALEEPYTPWTRIKCHTQPVYESEAVPFVPGIPMPNNYNTFDVISASINTNLSTKNALGGWHDAADWDRNINHYINVFDLLYAYEMAPQNFHDDQLNIPESGDGIPDILNEAEYGLRIWTKSMNSKNGVAGLVETWTHPSIDDPKAKYAFSLRTRWGSFIYAAAAAQFAYLVKPFNSKLSDEYEKTAINAYNFAMQQNNSLGNITIHSEESRGEGKKFTLNFQEKDSYNYPFQIFAGLRLFILTDDKKYLKDLPNLLMTAPKPYDYPYTLKDFTVWLYFPLFSDKVKNNIAESEIKKFKTHYLNIADEYINNIKNEPYRQSWPHYQNYWMSWGVMTMTNQARGLLIAYHLTGNEKYKNAAILNIDYMLGANPMGMCWTTGLGYTYPIEIQHAPSFNDGIMDPVPGITIYGNTEGMYYNLKNMVWQSPVPGKEPKKFLKAANWNIPTFRQWACHPFFNPPQCEFTIHETMSSTIFSTAMLLSPHWMPSEQLKNKEPRKDDLLFGYWYVP